MLWVSFSKYLFITKCQLIQTYKYLFFTVTLDFGYIKDINLKKSLVAS